MECAVSFFLFYFYTAGWFRSHHLLHRRRWLHTDACRAISEPLRISGLETHMSRLILRGKHQTMELAGVEENWEWRQVDLMTAFSLRFQPPLSLCDQDCTQHHEIEALHIHLP